MFGLRWKSEYRKYTYTRVSEKDNSICTVYESQYNPVLDISSFGLIGFFLGGLIFYILNTNYEFAFSLLFFICFMLIRIFMITEEDKKSD